MKIRKLLIVDDEKFIRKGIRAILEKANTAFGEIFEAKNGKEGLEAIRKEKFDLVITDIRMPLIDGIAFMMEASKLLNKPKFIVLSGYDDFNYAKEAIRYGVREYLLKPVKREELLEAVQRVGLELDREEKIINGNQQLNVMINNFREHELNYLIQNRNLADEEVLNIVNAINADILKGKFYVAVVVCLDSNDINQNWNRNIQTRILVSKYFERRQTAFLCFQSIKEELVLITKSETDYAGLIQYLKESLRNEYCIGVSHEGLNPWDISAAYAQACEALRHRVIKPSGNAIYYDQICEMNTQYQIPADLIKKISQAAGTAHTEVLDCLINQIFDEEAMQKNSIDYTLKIVDALDAHVIEYFKACIPQKANDLNKKYGCLKSPYNFRNIRDYKDVFKNYIFEINDFILTIKNTCKETYEIDAAISYMKENFHKDLSMAMVANHVSLNYSYFSFLFNQRTGKSFMDFLKELRIEKAKEFLRDTNWKINEVSQKAGFKNSKHFSRVFKAITGISPVEYKGKFGQNPNL